MEFLVLILRAMSIALGIFLLYVAIFMHASERGKIQNRLVDWWVRVELGRESALAWHVRFITTFSRSLLGRLDWVFGKRNVSIRAIWTAWFLSSASVVLAGIVFLLSSFIIEHWLPGHFGDFARQLAKERPIPYADGLTLAIPQLIGCLALALLPALVNIRQLDLKAGLTRTNLMPVLLLFLGKEPLQVYGVFLETGYYAATLLNRWDILGFIVPALLAAIACDLILVAGVRAALRQSSDSKTTVTGLILLVMCLLGAFFVSLSPLWLMTQSRWMPPVLLAASMGALTMNVLDVLLALSVLLALVVLLVHRAIWHTVERPLYALYANLPNSKITGALGFVFLGLGFPKLAENAASVLKAFLG